MKRMFWVMILVFVFFPLWLASPWSYAQEKAITLNFSNFFPAQNRISILMVQWCEEVEKRTNGRVKVTHFPGGTLTPPAQTYAGVIKGIADIGMISAGYTKGRFPLSEVIDLPLGYKSGYWGTKMANEYYKKFKPKEFDEVKIIFFHTSPPHLIHFAKKAVNNLEDLKGLKIRSIGTFALIIKALGGAPVSMPMTEAYDSLSKAVIQGISCPYEPMKGFNLAEVINYSTEFDSAWAGLMFVCMNKDKWNAFPADIQRVIEEINEEYIEKIGNLWDEYNKEGKDFFIQKGGKITVLSKKENTRWAERLSSTLDEYAKEKKSMGLPADEVLRFCIDYLKTHQK